jgi:branched-chain amino acid transport system permease protein
MTAILSGAVAVIIGGVGIFEGAAVGAMTLGILQSLVIWQTSSRWADAVTFVVLILFLLFRPQGIVGQRRRVEEAAS